MKIKTNKQTTNKTNRKKSRHTNQWSLTRHFKTVTDVQVGSVTCMYNTALTHD